MREEGPGRKPEDLRCQETVGEGDPAKKSKEESQMNRIPRKPREQSISRRRNGPLCQVLLRAEDDMARKVMLGLAV